MILIDTCDWIEWLVDDVLDDHFASLPGVIHFPLKESAR